MLLIFMLEVKRLNRVIKKSKKSELIKLDF